MITIVVANHANSNSRGNEQVSVEEGTSVRDILAAADITVGEGQTVSFAGADVQLGASIRENGFMSVTGETKAAAVVIV